MSPKTPIHLGRLLLVIVVSWLEIGCGAAPPVPPPASIAASSEPGAQAESAAEPSGETEPTGPEAEPPPLMPFGVPECDRFITKYVACVEQRVPADQRARLMEELHKHRGRWRELSRMEQGLLAVGLNCRGVAQRLKGGLTVDYGCEF